MSTDIIGARYKSNNRILALDLLRGYFLVVILINHIELYPNFFDLFTGRGRLLVSAAEGFFFMSGLLVGMVYKRRLELGMKFIFRKMWKRAFQLYLASAALTLLFTYLAVRFDHPSIKDGIADTINWWHVTWLAITFRYGFGWADFLDRFAILMFLAPFGFYLMSKRKTWLLLAVSLTAWAFRGYNFILSWQIVFTLGMIIGFNWNELSARFNSLRPVVRRRLKIGLASFGIVTFILSYASVYLLSLLNQRLTTLPHDWQAFTLKWNTINAFVWRFSEKWNVGPLRIIMFLSWFTALYFLVRRYENQINRATLGVLELLGRNSLFVYIAHAFIVFGFKFFIFPGHPLWINFIVTGAALACLIGATVIYRQFIPDKRHATGAKADKTSGYSRQRRLTSLKSFD